MHFNLLIFPQGTSTNDQRQRRWCARGNPDPYGFVWLTDEDLGCTYMPFFFASLIAAFGNQSGAKKKSTLSLNYSSLYELHGDCWSIVGQLNLFILRAILFSRGIFFHVLNDRIPTVIKKFEQNINLTFVDSCLQITTL